MYLFWLKVICLQRNKSLGSNYVEIECIFAVLVTVIVLICGSWMEVAILASCV